MSALTFSTVLCNAWYSLVIARTNSVIPHIISCMSPGEKEGEKRIRGLMGGTAESSSNKKAQDHLCWPFELLGRVYHSSVLVILERDLASTLLDLSARRPLAASICPFSDLINSPTV